MSEEQIKQYYERIEKLLNGANKETYGFAPEEIRQILKWYEHYRDTNIHLIDKNNYLMNENKQLKKELEEYCKKEIEREEQERLDYLIEQEEAFNQYNDFEFEDYMYEECDNNDC